MIPSSKSYTYEKSGKWYVLDDATAKEVTRKLAKGECVDTGGVTLYPQLPRPSGSSANTPRTCIHDGANCETVLWYWRIQPHDKCHAGCIRLEDGLCGVRCAQTQHWDEALGRYVADPLENKAMPEQERKLDSKFRR